MGPAVKTKPHAQKGGNGLFDRWITHRNQDIFKKNLPNRILDDIIEDINYQLIATINEIKPRKDEDLFNLYVDQGGEDIKEDFLIKWNSGKINKSNVRELRELKQKIVLMKK